MVSDDDCGGRGGDAVKHDGSIERQMDATEPTLKFNSEDIISRGIEQWIEATPAPSCLNSYCINRARAEKAGQQKH